MVVGLFGPKWFNEIDIVIDLVSIAALFLIGFFSIRYYRINKSNKNYLYLGLSFFLLALSFVFLVLLNIIIFYDLVKLTYESLTTNGYGPLEFLNVSIYIGLLAYRLLTLYGLYLLYSIYKKQTKSTILVITYLILISTLFSISAYYIFHMTSLLFLTLIAAEYAKQFTRTKYAATKLLMWSFGIIAVSQVVSILIRLHIGFYVLSQFIQLLGYSLLLITFILVLKHGKTDKD